MPHSSWWPCAALVAAVLCVRLWAASIVPLGDDEAYYWLWSTRPAMSYFDHSGGVAWSIWSAVEVFGDHAWVVRLPSVLAQVGMALLVGAVVAPRVRVHTVALGLFIPVFGLIGVFAAPDAAFLCCWMASLVLARTLSGPDPLHRWAGVGALVGGTLLFKLTGVLLGAGLVLWLSINRDRRRWWTGAGPWVAVGTALVVSLPVVVWNAWFDWPMFRFHAIERHSHSVSFWTGLGTWVGAHLVLLTPPLVWGAYRAIRRRRADLWIWAGLPCWIVFTVAAFFTPSKVHWWAPAWLSILPLIIRELEDTGWLRRALPMSLAGLHVAVLALVVVPPGPVAAWTGELHGWTALAERLQRDHPDAVAWATPRYQTSAQLAWGARSLDGPTVLRLGGRADQFRMWKLDRVPGEGKVMLVCASHLPCSPADLPELHCPGPKTTMPVHHDSGRVIRTFALWACRPAG